MGNPNAITVDDPHDLRRFIDAQDEHGTYGRVLVELRLGRKTSHWMWFVFPQIAGLGHSATSRRYALASGTEAAAYARHPVLGDRLRECADILIGLSDRTAAQIFGPVDSQKLQSSMTLFMRAVPEDSRFAQVLERYFEGVADAATDRLL
jgi:uncharacterized protein (DUF1810 family)